MAMQTTYVNSFKESAGQSTDTKQAMGASAVIRCITTDTEQQKIRAPLNELEGTITEAVGQQVTVEDIMRKNQLKKEKQKERQKLKRKAKKVAQRAIDDATVSGEASVNGVEHVNQGPAAKRPKHSYLKEGKALPQGPGPIAYYVLIEPIDGSSLDETGRTTFLGRYTRSLAIQPRDSPHRGFISAGVHIHEARIKIFCFTLEGATSVKVVAESAVDETGYYAYKGTVYKEEKLTRIIVGIPEYMGGPEMGDGDLVVRALESLNHGDDPLPVDSMIFMSKHVGDNDQVSVFLDVNDAVISWLKRNTWSFRTVSSVATAHIVKTSQPLLSISQTT